MSTETVPQTTTPTVAEALNTPFLKELVRQVRAQDSHGFYRNWSDELMLKAYVVSKEAKRKIPVDGEVDPVTLTRIKFFYQAIAARVEQETGKMSQVVIDLSHEGFGWALVFCGRLLVVTRTLRDAQRFGYDSYEKLAAEGEKLTQSGIEMIQRFPEVAKV